MCADTAPGAAEGAWEDPQAHGLEFGRWTIFVHTVSSRLFVKS